MGAKPLDVMKRVALLGHPVGHSRSPAMHNAAFRELGLDWRYEALDVEPARFAGVLESLPGQGFVGANVTIPHKLRALEAADDPTEVARVVGAANTLSFQGGRVLADNTDVEGFLTALRERAPAAPAGMHALVLGAGGAGRGVVYALLSAGRGERGGLEPPSRTSRDTRVRPCAGLPAKPLCRAPWRPQQPPSTCL